MNTCLNTKKHNTNGRLITFCGLDGCGKSTMMKMLTEHLETRGCDVFLTKQPTEMIRKSDIFRTYMDKEDHSNYEYRALSLMAAADRVQHVNQVIIPALKEGKTVICDRYFYSCLANLRARGYMEDRWIYEIAEKEIIRPDFSFFLDLPVKVAVNRVRLRPDEQDRYIDMELQYKLRDEYRRICLENDGVLITSHQSPQETFEKILNSIKNNSGGLYNG